MFGAQFGSRKLLMCACAAIGVAITGAAAVAAPFEDLDFEQAVVQKDPSFPAGDVSAPDLASAAFPGWVATEDGTVLTYVWGTPSALDETSVALVSAALSPNYSEAPPQGNYAVQLSSYADAPPDLYKTSSISQTGDIPAGSFSIRFLIARPPGAYTVAQNPLFSVNGISVPVFPISPSGSSELWAGDIAPYAGSTATIAFTSAGVAGTFPSDEDDFDLDAISFSTQPVPEPVTAVGAMALCAAALLYRMRGRRFRTGGVPGEISRRR